jgi:hypothetical protein
MKAKRISIFVTVIAAAAFLSNGCSKYNTDGAGGCDFSAKAGAVALCGTGYFTTSSETGELAIAGTDADNDAVILIDLPDASVGTQTLDGEEVWLSYTDKNAIYMAKSGTVTITKLTATQLKCTFSCTAQSLSDNSTISITDGSFNVKKLGL